jgi:hypothetical protein
MDRMPSPVLAPVCISGAAKVMAVVPHLGNASPARPPVMV